MRQTNAYKDNPARKTTKVRKKMIKQSKKQHTTCMRHEQGTLYLHSSTWKARMSSLFGIKRKLENEEALWVAELRRGWGRLLLVEKTVYGQMNSSWKGSIIHRGHVNKNVRNVCAFDYNARRMRHREEIMPTLPSLIPIKKKKHSSSKGSHRKYQLKMLVHKDTLSRRWSVMLKATLTSFKVRTAVS